MSFISDKVSSLPPYLFSVLNEKKRKLTEQGIDVIDLGIGAPDLPTPQFIVNRMAEEIKNPENHRYPPYHGCLEFREAVSGFYQRRYGVEVDPETEVLALIGSKEGIAHLISAVINPGDGVMIPDPGYPVYRTAVHLAGGKSIYLPLDAKHGYVPKFNEISSGMIKASKLMFLNYPGNPTAATVTLGTFQQAISFAKKHHIGIAHDAAYDLITYGHYRAPSILQVPGAKEVAVELGSLSKSFNMTGWRIGYIVGNKEMIRALSVVKSNLDTGQFLAIQKAAAAALSGDLTSVESNNSVYEERMALMLTALRAIGIEVTKPKGTFFIWAPVPSGFSSARFAEKLLEEAGVIVTPGNAFGPSGEGYFRISLSVDTKRLKESAERMRKLRIDEG
ncbi:aminotransferase class I/II-fold pyridoxal phosphate-dependent enzyme [bacterium LRH843]|nr:aminotransferase class I/II-fold pyridoxal phosphate-dependent enzyme [bacterium LRH843]